MLWRSFLESLYVNTTQIRNKWDCRKSIAQSERRHLCCIVAIRSEWKLVGRFYGMLYLFAKCCRSLIWWEDALWKTFWATLWRTNSFIWFKAWVLPYNCEGPVKNRSIWKESVTWIVPRIPIVRGWNLEGWSTGCRPWGVGDDGRIGNPLKKRLNAKEVIFLKEKEELIFPIADGRIKPLEEIKTWEHPPWYGSVQFEERVTLTLLENQEGLFHHLTTRFRMPMKQLMTSGPCQETSYTAITLNPESNFTRRERNHSLFH